MPDTSSDATYQIRAFLARTRPLSGCDFGGDETFWNGRGLIEELALAHETDSNLHWSSEQCADAIRFVHSVEPTKGDCFCRDDQEISATCGFHVVLEFIEKQLRKETRFPMDNSTETPVYDQFVSELAVLQCVLAALESRPGTGEQERHLANVELTLRDSIKRLEDLYGPINTHEDQARQIDDARRVLSREAEPA